MSIEERNIAVPLVMKGFSDLAAEAGCKIRGGQTVLNPWFLIGGVATGVVKREEMIIPGEKWSPHKLKLKIKLKEKKNKKQNKQKKTKKTQLNPHFFFSFYDILLSICRCC